MTADLNEVTQLLKRVRGGETDAYQQLSKLIYAELRRIAAVKMHGERPNHTLTPTALANEAWLKLSENKQDYSDRTHFFAVAASAMRRVLIDHARARSAKKRGGSGLMRVDEVDIAAPENDFQLLVLDEALTRLADLDKRAAQVVELRYFAGLSADEIALILKVTRRTVDRDWATARVWLFDQISGAGSQ